MGKNAERLNNFDHICRYANTLAVFQGGAAKAIAYLGAYEKAMELGFVFSETAGTSAGSIFAALIAAGANPSQINDLITPEQLKKLAVPFPQNYNLRDEATYQRRYLRFFYKKYWRQVGKAFVLRNVIKKGKWLIKLFYKPNPLITGILNSISFSSFQNYGINNSQDLHQVIEGWLTKISGKEDLRFNQLDRNLWIVATNIETKSLQLWSKNDTPDARVADAVTASCCIPLYYSPFKEIFTDGGLVSNRPDFVFNNLPEHYNILSFRTKTDDANEKSFFSYLNNIISSILEGADDLQHKSIRNVETITIDVGKFNGLDFSTITEKDIAYLKHKGEEAMQSFYDSRVLSSYVTPLWDSGKTTDILDSMEQVISIVALWSMQDLEEVWISDLSLDWVWPLFPTILKWCDKDIKIRVFHEKKTNYTLKEEAIKRQLKHIGIEREESNPATMLRGFFFKDNSGWKAVCFSEKEGKFYGKIYSSPVDHDIIKAEILRISQQPRSPQRQFKPKLEKINPQVVIEALKDNIPYYTNATFSLEEVEIKDLCFMSRFVRGDKYVQIGSIFSLYANEAPQMQRMETAQIAMLDNKKSIVTPIIIEDHDGDLIVIKGNVRLLYAFKANPAIKRIKAIVVRNVETPLPSSNRLTIDRVYLSETKRNPEERYGKDFNKDLLRQVDQALRRNDKYLL